jgi:hypothetical protein
MKTIILLSLSSFLTPTHGFTGSSFDKEQQRRKCIQQQCSSRFHEPADDPTIQWDLFNKHHAKGSWKGVWTTYDYIGDVMDETVASVDLNLKENDDGSAVIDHTHTIVVGAKRSDCKTCFDSMEQKTLPVAQYTPDNVLQRSRLAGISMVNGPTILRSGAMATELILRHGDGRVRVVFNHAPVWEQVSFFGKLLSAALCSFH